MYKYAHLIPENIAPVGAKCIVALDANGNEVARIPLGPLTPPSGELLYRFLLAADLHVTQETADDDLARALDYAEANCDFSVFAGDLVESGAAESHLAQYKNIVATHSPTKPVYGIPGNHGHWSTNSSGYWEQYVGQPLYYSFEQGDDVFIMVGHYGGYHGDGIGWLPNELVSVEELQWLYETLEANRNRRCFVFTHVLPHEHGVGNPDGLYTSALIWKTTDGGVGQAFMSLLQHYKNIVFFHGHSHTRFDLQEIDPKANYSDANGYRSVHIPSLGLPRDVTADGTKLEKIYAESEGYIVDVYDGYIVLNGRDFVDNDADGHWLGIATYKIDTALVEIAAGTFSDPTGIIVTEVTT